MIKTLKYAGGKKRFFPINSFRVYCIAYDASACRASSDNFNGLGAYQLKHLLNLFNIIFNQEIFPMDMPFCFRVSPCNEELMNGFKMFPGALFLFMRLQIHYSFLLIFEVHERRN